MEYPYDYDFNIYDVLDNMGVDMKYIIDDKELIFTNPADAVMFAINNNCSEVQVETNMIKCKHKGKSTD